MQGNNCCYCLIIKLKDIKLTLTVFMFSNLQCARFSFIGQQNFLDERVQMNCLLHCFISSNLKKQFNFLIFALAF